MRRASGLPPSLLPSHYEPGNDRRHGGARHAAPPRLYRAAVDGPSRFLRDRCVHFRHLDKNSGVPFPLTFLAAGAAAALSSLVLVPITRLTGVYLAVATLGFTIIVHLIILNEEWLTGGSFGILGIPWPSIGPFTLKGDRASYYLALLLMLATFTAFSRIVASRFGRALRAIMLDEVAARASGINATLYKSKCFVIAALVTGFAGCLFAHNARYLNPNDFDFGKSIEILIMATIGGMGSLIGAVLGAFVVVLLPEYLRALDQWRLVIYGALLILLMGLGAGGIAGLVTFAARRFASGAAGLFGNARGRALR